MGVFYLIKLTKVPGRGTMMFVSPISKKCFFICRERLRWVSKQVSEKIMKENEKWKQSDVKVGHSRR